ncbi:ABC transporter substrate-binding protein [Comamonas sp.]|uniref:ABC transporter substrate-binding protein n=1 Tax=Comamonas sp. TaxID=34028 RepID=UPI003D1121C6
MTMIPRRHFLASTSVAVSTTGGWSAAQALAPSAPARQTSKAWQLLAVAPQSHKVADLGSDYRRGLELGLAQRPDVAVQLHWVEAPPTPNRAARSITAAIDQRPQLHGVVGWMPPAVEAQVAAHAQPLGLPLWASDTGADLPAAAKPGQPQAVVRHSLDLCGSAAQLAQAVYQQLGPRAVLAVGQMEGGYDFVYTFEHAYRALGGRVVARHVGEFGPQSAEFDGLRTAVFSHRPDAVVALYSGPQLARFGRWWQAHAQSQGAWGLAGLPWLADVHTGGNAVTAGAWPSAAQAQPVWKQRFERVGLPWTAAALMGAEAGYSIAAALDQRAQQPSSSALRESWQTAILQGPRAGSLSTMIATTDVYNRPITPLISGWLNGYLQT